MKSRNNKAISTFLDKFSIFYYIFWLLRYNLCRVLNNWRSSLLSYRGQLMEMNTLKGVANNPSKVSRLNTIYWFFYNVWCRILIKFGYHASLKIGTFNTAEEGAYAYDCSVRLQGGSESALNKIVMSDKYRANEIEFDVKEFLKNNGLIG